jgi:FkbM family methyltransferase
MSIPSIAAYIVKPVSSLTRMGDAAMKLRGIMSSRDALRLATALCQEDPAQLPVAGNVFRLRRGTTDLYTFRDVFLQDSMRFVGDRDLDPSCIVDCGAHIGCASLFFALRYPRSRIVAIEPDKQNFDLLSTNVHRFKNVVPVNAAVWDRATSVRIANPGSNPTGLYVKESTEADDRCLHGQTISEIMEIGGMDHIDILKLDVEGAELRLFSSPDCHQWLSKVSVLIVELHDRLYPGCARALYRSLDRYEYQQEGRGYVVTVSLKSRRTKRISPTDSIDSLSSFGNNLMNRSTLPHRTDAQ